jgi:hypothetical protein
MGITPADARRIARDYVVNEKGLPSDARTRVSDFGALADGGYSVMVDVTLGSQEKVATRYRVKMDVNGNVKSFVPRQ